MKYEVRFTNQFKKDIKLAKKQGKDIDKLFEVVGILANGKELDEKYRNGVGLLDQFNRVLAADADFMTMMYNIGDGMTLAIRR